MSSLLQILSVISALVTTGQSLTCVDCFTLSSDSCTGSESKDCPSGYVCASQYSVSVRGPYDHTRFNRSCAPQAECGVTGSYTGTVSTDRIAITCCQMDYCTPATPQLPNTNSQPNGVWCQRCLSTGTNTCTGGLVQCIGEETMCLQKSLKQTLGSQVVYTFERGCASKGYCNKGNTTAVYGDVTEEVTYICTDGAPNPAATSIATKPAATSTTVTKNNAATTTATTTHILFLFVILTIAF